MGVSYPESRMHPCALLVGREHGATVVANSLAVPQKFKHRGFPGGSVVKNLPANAGDGGSISGPGRFHMLQSH